MAAPKGLIYGNLMLHSCTEAIIDCKTIRTGTFVPNEADDIEVHSSDAKFILVVEKHATFNKLICNNICETFKVILVSSYGFQLSC